MKNNKGFTLMELIIVISIIAILSAVVVPSFMTYIKNAKITKDIAKAKVLSDAVSIALIDPNVPQDSINAAIRDWGFDSNETSDEEKFKTSGISLDVLHFRAYLGATPDWFSDREFCEAICLNLNDKDSSGRHDLYNKFMSSVKDTVYKNGNRYFNVILIQISDKYEVVITETEHDVIYPYQTGKYVK